MLTEKIGEKITKINTQKTSGNLSEKMSKIDFVLGDEKTIEILQKTPILKAFDPLIISFLNALANTLVKKAKNYPDIMAFAFFCAKSNILKYAKKYENLVGRGIALSSTPSNIPTNFAYSLVVSLLAGNKSIIRLPKKDFSQNQIIINTIKELLNSDFKELCGYIVLLKCASENLLPLSLICDARLIWGGDENVRKIKQIPTKIRNIDLIFSDRNSFCLIDAVAFLNAQNQQKIINDFYNDTYLIDQNACSSPKIIFWFGNDETILRAKKIFWDLIYKKVQNYELSPAKSVAKIHNFMKLVAKNNGIKFVKMDDNLILKADVNGDILDVLRVLDSLKINSGFFIEKNINDICEILKISSDKTQTLTYFGLKNDDFEQILKQNPKIDRIVPIGKALEFDFVWDGMDIVFMISRKIFIKK